MIALIRSPWMTGKPPEYTSMLSTTRESSRLIGLRKCLR